MSVQLQSDRADHGLQVGGVPAVRVVGGDAGAGAVHSSDGEAICTLTLSLSLFPCLYLFHWLSISWSLPLLVSTNYSH